jgi:hypothetical protein
VTNRIGQLDRFNPERSRLLRKYRNSCFSPHEDSVAEVVVA